MSDWYSESEKAIQRQADLLEERDQLRIRVAALEEGLRKYGHHLGCSEETCLVCAGDRRAPDCNVWENQGWTDTGRAINYRNPCTCGLAALLGSQGKG